jgi:hypothetical protein
MKLHTGGCLAVCILISFLVHIRSYYMAVLVYIYCVLMCFFTLAAVAELLDNAVDEVKIPCPLPSLDEGAQSCYILDKSILTCHACFGFLLNSLLLKHRYRMVLPEC